MSNKSLGRLIDAVIVVFVVAMVSGLGFWWNDNSDKRACRSRGGYVKGRGDDWRCELPTPAPVERAPCAESNRHPHPEN